MNTKKTDKVEGNLSSPTSSNFIIWTKEASSSITLRFNDGSSTTQILEVEFRKRKKAVGTSWRMNEAAIEAFNSDNDTTIAIRQVKYLNNIVEQDHRGVKRITNFMLGFKSFDSSTFECYFFMGDYPTFLKLPV